jgi:hypothetical protein
MPKACIDDDDVCAFAERKVVAVVVGSFFS